MLLLDRICYNAPKKIRKRKVRMKILAIVGSPRINGNTNYLTDQALSEAARLGVTTEKIIISEKKLNPCLGHQECSGQTVCMQKDEGMEILQKFVEADGLILTTPIYYYDISSWLKIFIDRNYFLYTHDINCKAKAAGLIVVGGGAGIEETVQSLNKFLGGSTLNISKRKIFVVSGYAGAPGEVRNKPELVNQAREMGKKLVESLRP